MELIVVILILAALVGIFARRFYLVAAGFKAAHVKPLIETEKASYEKESRLRKVSKMLQRGAHKIAPKILEAKMLYSRAMKYYEKGDMEEAEKKLIQVTSLDEDFHDAFHKLGLIYL